MTLYILTLRKDKKIVEEIEFNKEKEALLGAGIRYGKMMCCDDTANFISMKKIVEKDGLEIVYDFHWSSCKWENFD